MDFSRFYPVCVFYKITGLHCPGCGTIRAFEALAELDFAAAFMYNPFLFLVTIPFIVYMSAIYLTRRITGRWVPSIFSSPKAPLRVGIAIVGIWIFRNVFPLGLSQG